MLYEYKCSRCGNVFEVVMKLKDFTTTKKCRQCGGRGKKQLSSRHAVSVFEPYHDKIQNRVFNTRKEFDTYCREKDLYKPTQSEIKVHREEYSGRKE